MKYSHILTKPYFFFACAYKISSPITHFIHTLQFKHFGSVGLFFFKDTSVPSKTAIYLIKSTIKRVKM